MQLAGKVRAAVDTVQAAASDTKQAVIAVGVVAAVALIVGLVALLIGSRRPVAARL
jgi:hypothetical protein